MSPSQHGVREDMVSQVMPSPAHVAQKGRVEADDAHTVLLAQQHAFAQGMHPPGHGRTGPGVAPQLQVQLFTQLIARGSLGPKQLCPEIPRRRTHIIREVTDSLIPISLSAFSAIREPRTREME